MPFGRVEGGNMGDDREGHDRGRSDGGARRERTRRRGLHFRQRRVAGGGLRLVVWPALIGLLSLPAIAMIAPAGAATPTPITSCDATTVSADIAAGGSYVFQCSGTISVTAGFTVTNTLSLDATGQSVFFDYTNPVFAALNETRFA